MALQLQRVRVDKLFGLYDLDVPITDNVIVLVGENGSGKSTLISLIYYSLTAQWDRLCDLPFDSLSLTINDENFVIDREALRLGLTEKSSDGDFNRLLRQLREQLESDLEKASGKAPKKHKGSKNSKSPAVIPSAVTKLEELIREQLDNQILFLPTYRRIEKELEFLFPQLDLEGSLIHRQPTREQRESYIELIEFGMQDVEAIVRDTLENLDQSFRTDLNRLTGSYLREVIQEEHKRSHVDELASAEVGRTVDSMLSRMEDDVLSEEDRVKLRELLASIQAGHQLDPEQQILAHFLSRLVSIHRKQQEREKPVRDFAAVANKYLSGKEFSFDPLAFKLDVRRTSLNGTGKKQRKLSLQGLSSGEKQIVSLFSHIYLSGTAKQYFVLIDEPELSISVEWQRNFLEDIRKTGQCGGLIAVTHSPFIFENSLAEFAHSMHEFTKPSPERSESAA